jgi:type I restriction enzyme S subunit
MTPEVKKRIEQIRQGIVPEGYKKGKIGIVPIKWNEVPFSTLFTSTSEYTDDLKQYPLYSLTIEDGITAKTERYERSHLVKKENSYKVVRPNDYAYNPMNIRFGAVARHKGDIPVAVSGYYDIFTTVHESDLVFMDSFLTYGPMITYYNKVSTGSLVEKQRVHFSDFLEFSLALPPLEERKKIAEILSTQDKAIELQGRKIEELKRFKKGCLEKMFPRKGQKVPEKRFPGFTDDWEQRKLNAVVSRESATKISSAKFPSVEYEDVISEEGHLNKDIYQKEPGKNGIAFDGSQVLYGKLRPYLHNWLNPDFKGVAVGDWWVMKPIDADKNFLYRLIQTPQFDNVSNQSSGSKMPRADWNLVSNTEFMIPYSKVEQHKIGEYFSSLDHLITLHQRKLEEMKRQKKALMQLLLTGIVRI